jgi:carboxyl-terminal processing protease
VAGALKDHKRALIARQRTFGKGSVQTVIPLAEDIGLKLTIARYYTPNGTSIQAKGIEPDIYLEDLDSDGVKKLRRKSKSISEADLKNHMANPEGEKNKAAGGDDEEKMADKDAPPRALDPKDDYQVQQALNYLKTMKFKAPTKAMSQGKADTKVL